MANVLLVVLLIISIILIGLILIQRSEGGALGIGGSGGGGLMSGRGTADLVSRMTAIFGAAFLLVSLLISISFNYQNQDSGPFNAGSAQEEMATEAVVGENSQNNDLNAPAVSDKDTTPLVGDSQTAESATNPQEQSEEKTEETPQD